MAPLFTGLRLGFGRSAAEVAVPFSATGGDTTRTVGSYTVHTFTTAGSTTFVVSGNQTKTVQYVVVGGGGHGVAGSGGGGGAGGYRTGTVSAVGAGTYNIQVGQGSLITPFPAPGSQYASVVAPAPYVSSPNPLSATSAAPRPKPNFNPVKRGAIISNSYSTLTEPTILGGINLIT